LILQRRQRQTSQEEGAWTDEEKEDYLVKHPSVTRPYAEQDSILDARSPSKKRNSAGHSRQISTASTSSYTSGYNHSPNKVSKSVSERQLAISLHLQEQHQQLASQNAELEEQLQDLELELQRADTSGKKKLRKLDRELDTLRQELQSALDRNRELEESLQRDKKSSSGSITVSSTHRITNARRLAADSPHTHHAQEISLPPDTDSNEGLYSPSLPSVESAFPASQILQHTASHALSTERDGPEASEAVIVSQLLQKIAELKETNAAIEQDKEQMDAKLQKASEEFEEMKRKYDFLEDRVIEAEVRAHRVIGWDRRATIGWYSGWEQVRSSP
jgi:predicted RNase H-like nuclease (RuvC/YqgF family)